MKQIRISDVTMKQTGADISLSFREKIELSKLLDKLGVTVIELEPLVQPKIDALRIKSIAATVKNSIVAVPVALDPENIRLTLNALKETKKARPSRAFQERILGARSRRIPRDVADDACYHCRFWNYDIACLSLA